MGGFNISLKLLTFSLLLAFFVWSSSTFEPCNARRSGKHWRQRSRAVATSSSFDASLYKNKKVKSSSHGSSKNHHSGGTGGGGGSATSKPPSPISPVPDQGLNDSNSTTFDVLDFGAKGDGNTDDTKAFEDAWAAACKVEGSTIIVPTQMVFLVGPISFSGPYCESNIVFQLDGTIVAPTSSKAWSSGLLQWLEFSKLRGITIQGGGTIDGRGSVWWKDSSMDNPIDDETRFLVPIARDPAEEDDAPTPALRFYGSYDVTVKGITIVNSPQCHLKFDNCIGVQVFNINISSPGDSLNTDGIHLQNSKDVLIHDTNLACGDDCVSIQTGCSNVYIHNVNCGPGHGISIGGLGRDDTKACVSNITVRDIMMHNTMNGVRIKTWQGGSGSVQGVLFSNIQVSEVEFPIVIDQFYCDKSTCKNQTSAVALAGINYEKIRGTYTVKPVHFACSDSLPCVDVTLTNIELKPVQERYHLSDPFCWQTFGQLSTPTVPPIDCLQIGKPSSNRIQSDHDSCYT
ncbi:Glycoside hydrolase [Macleaya cordata]|uniref:Glycoside hydrolase n=1 Tax=Macleaya cordata TaxID=56857 RepID=A0A200R2N1_MACCD|nr:Glycoside hydrolase [Macleaya cordata]